MSGEFLTQTLAPGQTMQFQKAGRYFEVIADGGSTFNFNFYGPNGAQSANWKNCQAGMFLEDPYSAFDVTNNSTSAQTITMLLMDNGRGGSRRQPGNVRIIDEITDAISEVNLVPSLAVQAPNWTQMIAPASNTRGIILRGYSLKGQPNGASGTLNLTLVACKSLPTGYQVPAQRYLVATLYMTSANPVVGTAVDCKLNKFLPPGWGMYGGIEVQTGAAQLAVIQFDSEILT